MPPYLVLLILEFLPARLATLPNGLDSNVTQLLANMLTKPSVFYYLPIVSCNLVSIKLLLLLLLCVCVKSNFYILKCCTSCPACMCMHVRCIYTLAMIFSICLLFHLYYVLHRVGLSMPAWSCLLDAWAWLPEHVYLNMSASACLLQYVCFSMQRSGCLLQHNLIL